MPATEQHRDTGAPAYTAELDARLARYPAPRYPAQHATAAFHLGATHLEHGRPTEALDALRTAFDLFARLGMRLEQSKALTMRGVALRDTGRADLAGECFERAAQIFAELSQQAEEAAARYNLGLVLQQLGDADAARSALARAFELFLLAGHPTQAGAAAREHGASLLTSGDVGSALPLLEKAAALAERNGDLPGLGLAANALGLAHLASDDAASALEAFWRAVGAFPRSMRPSEHAMVKANLALAYERAGNPARARLAARQALMASAELPVRLQAQQLLDRLRDGSRADLLTVLDAEPFERWPAIVRDEVLRCVEAGPAELSRALNDVVDSFLDRPGTSYDLAESLLAVVLELPPGPYGDLVTAIVRAAGARPDGDGERVRAVMASAMARFAIPQWQRLASSLNAAAAAAGQPTNWR